MPANYSQNPTAPTEDQGQVMDQQGMMEPSSIRDYLAIAKQGAARFTNIPGQAQPGTMYMPEQTEPQAIPEGQVSEYERMPFSQRVGLSPYIRAKERVQTMLPELWQTMFPGMQQGVTLEEHQMKQWQGAVAALTGNLLKHYDKQYGASLKIQKQGKKQRESDRRYWQQDFWKQKQMGRAVIDQEGNPISEAMYVTDRMNSADEMRIKDELRDQKSGVEVATDRFDVKQIGTILDRNPELKQQMMFQIRNYMQQVLGSLSDDQFRAAMSNPEYKSIKDEAIRDTLTQYNDEIIKASEGPQEQY